ncbi:kinase-like domain-containing protein [Mycena polygramma]|nr:kinase-like domain-containing protein [Mycena polygramma]
MLNRLWTLFLALVAQETLHGSWLECSIGCTFTFALLHLFHLTLTSTMHTSHSALLPDLTGDFIDDGSLLLVCLLGSGSFGKVYKALDTTSPADDPVYYAVKCMHLYELGSLEGEMQAKELRIHAMLDDHPGVISLHRVCATEEFVFAVLELATGGDLYGAMVDRQCFRGNPSLIKQVLGEILDAVEFCHRNGIYHRDIKPENILCNSAGTDIRLADFGLATQNGVSTSFGCGTSNYTTPESMDCESSGYSPRHSDLWAVSIIFASMISGRAIWASADMSDPWYAAFRANEDAHLSALKITRPANDLLKRCLHLNPRRRPTLEEFREAVNAIDMFSLHDDCRAPAAPRVQSIASPPAPAAPPSAPAADDCPTPKPAFPPIYTPKPIRPTPITLTLSSAFSASASSPSIVFAPVAPAPVSSSPSSPPSSVPSSASSAPSAADASPPATPAVLPVDAADAQLSTVSSLAVDAKQQLRVPPPLPPRRYLDAPAPAKPAEQVTAANARPTPTRRHFFAGRKMRIRAWIIGAKKSYEKSTKKIT